MTDPDPNEQAPLTPPDPGPPTPARDHVPYPSAPPAPYDPYGAVPKPGVIPLRPLGLGEILDGSISTMRRHPSLMIGSSAVVIAVTTIVQTAVIIGIYNRLRDYVAGDAPISQADAQSFMFGSLSIALVTVLISALGGVFLSGFLTVVVGRAVLGQQITWRGALDDLRPKMWRLLGVTVLFGLIVSGGMLLCIVPGIYWLTLYALCAPALILENAGVTAALRRSKELVTGSWWRIRGITLLAIAIGIILSLVVSLPFQLGSGALGNLGATDVRIPSNGALVLQAIGTILAGTLSAPFTAGVTALLYIDQRIRKEGLDIELARASGVQIPGRW